MRGNTYSKKQSSEQISRKLSEFIKEIQYKNRNPVDNNVLKMLQEMETNPELLFDSQQYLYRSRIVHSKDNQYAAFQLLTYSSFLYKPVTELCCLKGEKASTFMKNLHTSHGFLH